MRIVACGVGNKERGDDAFGSYVIERLHEKRNLKKIDCGLHPENYLNKIIALTPDLVIFFDTIAKGEGAAIILRNQEIVERSPVSVTTHSLSFGAMYHFLRENNVRNVLFLGVPAVSYRQFSSKTRLIADRLVSVLDDIEKTAEISIVTIYEALSEQIR
jgi:hydrogenase 3 maturation protease